MQVEEELRTYLMVLWRYKGTIGACALIASIVALGISLLLTPLYEGTATLRVASTPIGAVDYISSASLTQLMNTYVEIATSDISLDAVAERLGLPKQPKVEVEVVPETELIQISASDADPARARDIANMLAGMIVEQGVKLYGGSAPTAREILEDQLKQAKADLDAAVSEYDAALRSLATPSESAAQHTPMSSAELATMERLVSIRQEIYGELLQRYENARINEQVRANAITLVEPAGLALRPSSPKLPLNTALGLVAGLATGVILAFLFESMDDTVRGVEDVRTMTTLPILCAVPDLKPRSSPKANRHFSGNGHLSPAPAFHQLRARLILSDDRPQATTILLTSPDPGAGKSTVVTNLALSLAEGGSRVVLIDMDVRRPRLHSILGLPNENGLSNFIRGESPLDEILQTTKHPNLLVATAGSDPDFPADWLVPEKIGELLGTLGKKGDYVLVDAPALLSVADPAILASQADAVILVVARRKTGRENLNMALQQLAELKAKVAGIVVNRVPDSGLYGYYAERSSRTSAREQSNDPTAGKAPGTHAGS